MEPPNTNLDGNGDPQPSPLSRGVDHAATTAHGAVDSVADTARPAVERMATSAHEAVDRFAAVATQAADSLGVKGDQLIGTQNKIAAGTRDYVREHPAAALGIAVAAGYVLSRVLSSR